MNDRATKYIGLKRRLAEEIRDSYTKEAAEAGREEKLAEQTEMFNRYDKEMEVFLMKEVDRKTVLSRVEEGGRREEDARRRNKGGWEEEGRIEVGGGGEEEGEIRQEEGGGGYAESIKILEILLEKFGGGREERGRGEGGRMIGGGRKDGVDGFRKELWYMEEGRKEEVGVVISRILERFRGEGGEIGDIYNEIKPEEGVRVSEVVGRVTERVGELMKEECYEGNSVLQNIGVKPYKISLN